MKNIVLDINVDSNCIIKEMFLKLTVNIPLNDSLFSEFFPYKLFQKIELLSNDYVLFTTNGMIIKSEIDVFNKEYKMIKYGYIHEKNDLIYASENPVEFLIPLFLKFEIPMTKECKMQLRIDCDDLIDDVNIRSHLVMENKETINETYGSNIKTNQMDIIIPEGLSMTHNMTYQGHVRHILFCIEGDIKVSEVKIALYHNHETFSYTELNVLIPYYCGYKLPKNYMLICYPENEKPEPRKVEHEIEFKLKRNNGGKIYVISQGNNVLMGKDGLFVQRYSFVGNMHCDNYVCESLVDYDYDKMLMQIDI